MRVIQITIIGLVLSLLLGIGDCLANPLTTEEEVAGGRIGTWPGSLAETCARKHFPQAKYVYLDTVADMAQNLRQKKIEAFAMNRIFVDELTASGQNDVEILGEPLGRTSFSLPGKMALCRWLPIRCCPPSST